MRKVYIDFKGRLILLMDEDASVRSIMDNMELVFEDTTGKADVSYVEIEDFEVTDSK